MPITALVREFGDVLEVSTRLRSEIYQLNMHLVQRDPLMTMNDLMKVKATFKDLKVVMTDLERAVDKVIGDVPTLADLFPS